MEQDLRLLLEWEHQTPKHWAKMGAGSIISHVILVLFATFLLQLPTPLRAPLGVDLSEPRRNVTPLVAPPLELTQRAPNRNQPSKEFNLSSIPPRPESPNLPQPGAAALPRQAAKRARLPNQRRAVVPSTTLTEAPSIEGENLRAALPTAPPPALGVPSPNAPPPQIATEEKPKLTFERPGAPTGTGTGRIPTPSHSIDETIREAARGARAGGIIVGDADGGPTGAPNSPRVPLPGKMGSAVELLSDPMGADFWPYLLKVLSSVRRNWFAVIPESAKLGRVGRVVVQFAINKDGNVAKVVFAQPSGAEALDRAAVASISASNPFPPLPNEFKGSQIRLQFVFKYNIK